MAGSHIPKRHHHHYGTGKHKHVRHSSSPGSAGHNDPAHPGFGPCFRGDTPGPTGHGGDFADPDAGKSRMHNKKTPILVMDSRKTHAFLKSVAYAKAQQAKVRMRWVEDQSKFMQGLYSVMFWKGKPGTVEVDTGDWKEIDRVAAADTKHMLAVMMRKAGEGPKALTKYLKGLEEIRDYALEAIRDVYKEAGELNHEVREHAAQGIKRLAAIKFGADLIMAGLSAVPGAGMVVPLLYSWGGELIRSIDEAPSAQVIGFTGIFLEKGAHHVLAHSAEHGTEKIAEAQEAQELQAELSQEEAKLWRELISEQKRSILQGNVTGAEAEKLYRQIGKEARRGYGMQISARAAEEQARRLSRLRMLGKAAGGAVQVVFFAVQARESWDQMKEVFEHAEQGAE